MTDICMKLTSHRRSPPPHCPLCPPPTDGMVMPVDLSPPSDMSYSFSFSYSFDMNDDGEPLTV